MAVTSAAGNGNAREDTAPWGAALDSGGPWETTASQPSKDESASPKTEPLSPTAKPVRRRGFGLVGNIGVAFIGAAAAAFLLGALGLNSTMVLIGAVAGAAVLLTLAGLFKR